MTKNPFTNPDDISEAVVNAIGDRMDWTAPHYESESDFLDANTRKTE